VIALSQYLFRERKHRDKGHVPKGADELIPLAFMFVLSPDLARRKCSVMRS
jgi:hypothetical protein